MKITNDHFVDGIFGGMTDAMNGLVVRSTGSWNTVRLRDGKHIESKLRGQFRQEGLRSTNPIAVGDQVDITMEKDGTASIIHIHERRNHIVRKSVNLSKEMHVIAANMDQAAIIATVVEPRTSPGFIDRFLCVAEAYGIAGIVVLNKLDLNTTAKTRKLTDAYVETYAKAGYPVFQVSAETGEGMESLREALKGKVTLVSGHSGVGKSTLLNALRPDLELRTGDISSVHHKGKHTTTFAEMFELEDNCFVIDTPGVKEFGMVDMGTAEVPHYFPEIFRTSEQCRFGNCLHVNEPGCAVKKAVEDNLISESRYSSYLNILESLS